MPLNILPNLWKTNNQSLSQILWSCDRNFHWSACGFSCVHIFTDVREKYSWTPPQLLLCVCVAHLNRIERAIKRGEKQRMILCLILEFSWWVYDLTQSPDLVWTVREEEWMTHMCIIVLTGGWLHWVIWIFFIWL